MSYNPAGEPTLVTFGNNDTDTPAYDSYYRPSGFKFAVAGGSPFTITGVLGLNQNSTVGSMSITDTNDSTKNQSCTYAADDLNRLKSANCGNVWSQTFTYDPMGNLTKTATAGMNYLAGYGAHNQVTSGTTFAYDADGNQTLNTVTGLTWNAAAQVVSAGSTTATYDALGRMVETVNGSTATEYVYSPLGSQYAVVSGTTLLRGLVPLPGGDTAVYNNSGLNYIRRTDVLGSSRLATTWATHQVYSMESYAPFGEPSDQAGTPDRSFTGQDQDLLPNSTIYDFQFRKQDSTSGRWLSPDPSGWNAVDFTNPQSLNRYAYAGNSPLMSVDHQGLDVYFVVVSSWCYTPCPQNDCGPNSQPVCQTIFTLYTIPTGGIPPGVPGFYWTGPAGQGTPWAKGIAPQPKQKKLPNCWAVGAGNVLGAAADTLGPITDAVGAISDLAAKGFNIQSARAALTAEVYAATKVNTKGGVGLLTPLRSSTYRGLLGTAADLAEFASIGVPLLTFDYYLIKRSVAEVKNPTPCT